MKIAVSAQGKGPDSPLDPRFGRAPGFVLFDTDSGSYGYLDNSGQVDLAQGAGIQTAQTIADAGVALLITGRVGPKAEAALEQAGIKVVLSDRDTVEQALADYREGGTAASPAAAPAGGRGMGGGGGRGMGGGGGGCRRTGGTGRGMGGGGGRGMGGGGRGGRGMGG